MTQYIKPNKKVSEIASQKAPKKTPKNELALWGGKPVRKIMPEQKAVIGSEELAEVKKVLSSNHLTSLSNDIVEDFEKQFADYCGVKYGIAVNSGTAALHVALAALDVGPGDEVIVPPYTFIATVSAVLQQNAVPVFADIDPATLNISASEIEKKITFRTRAIIPVHLFGLPADMKAINKIAKKHNIAVIEDACQSHGALYHGKMVGGFGKMACFSFQESKNMVTGEGGIVVTNDKKLADKCRIIKHIGMRSKYEYITLGYNYRLPAMSAAVGIAQLKKLDGFNAHRRMMADYYREHLSGLPLETISEPADVFSSYHLFPVILNKSIAPKQERTAEIIKALNAENIPAWWVYPRPIYEVDFIVQKKAYKRGCPFNCPMRDEDYGYGKGACPAAEDIAARTVVLPTSPCFSLSVAKDTVKAIRKVVGYFAG